MNDRCHILEMKNRAKQVRQLQVLLQTITGISNWHHFVSNSHNYIREVDMCIGMKYILFLAE